MEELALSKVLEGMHVKAYEGSKMEGLRALMGFWATLCKIGHSASF